METAGILIAFCVICGIWNIVVSLLIYDALRKRGIPVSFIWLKALAPVYAHRIKEISKSETGKAGALFYQWIISINLALVFAVIALFVWI